MQVLLIEDEKTSELAVRLMLSAEGFTVSSAALAYEGIALALSGQFDVIVLDLELPDLHGHQLLALLRQQAIETPIIIISGHSNIRIKTLSFQLGADDYISKPFHRDEFIARIYAISRRYRPNSDKNIVTGDLMLDPSNLLLQCKDEAVKLTPREAQIFNLLARRRREFVSDETVFQTLYPDRNDNVNRRTISVHIHNLRKKIRSLGSEKHIVREWGQGYALR